MYRHRQASPYPPPMPTFADLQDCHSEMDAPLHQSFGKTATPPVGVKLTLQITLIPTATGWTVSLSEHFPHVPTVPAPPPPRELPPKNPPRCPTSVEASELPARPNQHASPGGLPVTCHRKCRKSSRLCTKAPMAIYTNRMARASTT